MEDLLQNLEELKNGKTGSKNKSHFFEATGLTR